MDFKVIFNNAKWIIVCKVLQSLLQLIIGMLCARYLGPSNYGVINYAASIFAFVLPVTKLGFDSTLVNEYVKCPDKEGEIMGTSLVMNLLSALFSFGLVATFVFVVNGNEKETVVVCLLYSISLFCCALEMTQYWFQYKMLAKYSSIVMLVAYIIVAIYRIMLLVTDKHIYWFALTNVIDFGIIGISLLVIYKKLGKQKLAFSFEIAKGLFARGKHYILASLMLVVIQNTDHIMLTSMVSKAENGFYSAAITCTSVTQFVFTAIIDSFRPQILANKKENEYAYKKSVSLLYGIISYLSIAQSIFFVIFSKWIVVLLYGNDFIAAVPVLRILSLYFVFSFMGTVRNVWILAEQKQKYLWIINLSGALINITLNSVLIPGFGAPGAAVASLITQIFANFILGFILTPIRQSNVLFLQGLNPVFLIDEGKKLISELKNNKCEQKNTD